MNEAKFTELVNLYFDQEISAEDLAWLQHELVLDPARKRDFNMRYRLHQAMRLALAADAQEAAKCRDWVIRKASQASRLTASMLGSGMAVGLSIAFLLLTSSVREFAVEIDSSYLDSPLAGSDLERFTMRQAVETSRRGSLASQLRLLGLTPQLAPAEYQLSAVDLEAVRQREACRQREIERLNQYKAYSAMPDSKWFDFPEPSLPDLPRSHWSAGFQSTLANF